MLFQAESAEAEAEAETVAETPGFQQHGFGRGRSPKRWPEHATK